GVIGFIDDYLKVTRKNTRGVPGKVRLGWEFALAGAVMAYVFLTDMLAPDVRLALQVPFIDFKEGPQVLLPAWLYVAFATVVVVGTANAVNLTDGLDGLAIGPSVISAGTFMVFAYIAGSGTIILTQTGD